jgi:hypothetical protein
LAPWPITERDDSTGQFVTNGEQIADSERLAAARTARARAQISQVCAFSLS